MNTEEFTSKVARLPFSRHPAFKTSPTLMGYKHFTFGGRYARSIHVDHLCHELGHAAEFGPEQFKSRAALGRFSFKSPPEYSPSSSHEATARECRAAAYHLIFLELTGESIDYHKFISDFQKSLDFMQNIDGFEHDNVRYAFMEKIILDTRESVSTNDAIQRMTGWLDCTNEQLLVA